MCSCVIFFKWKHQFIKVLQMDFVLPDVVWSYSAFFWTRKVTKKNIKRKTHYQLFFSVSLSFIWLFSSIVSYCFTYDGSGLYMNTVTLLVPTQSDLFGKHSLYANAEAICLGSELKSSDCLKCMTCMELSDYEFSNMNCTSITNLIFPSLSVPMLDSEDDSMWPSWKEKSKIRVLSEQKLFEINTSADSTLPAFPWANEK